MEGHDWFKSHKNHIHLATTTVFKSAQILKILLRIKGYGYSLSFRMFGFKI